MNKSNRGIMVCVLISMILYMLMFSRTYVNVNAAESINTDKETTKDMIYVVGNKNDYPIEYYNYFEKTYKGAMPDLLDKISMMTGIRFVYVDHKRDISELLQNLQVDMISDYDKNTKDREEYNLTLSPVCFQLLTGDKEREVCLAFTETVDSQTISRISQAVQSIDSTEREQMLLYNISDGQENYYDRVFKYALGAALLLFGLVCIILLFLNIRYRKKFKKIVNKDILTGYGNSKKLHNKFAACVTAENCCTYCIVNLSIENFDKINEEYGFDESNLLLKRIADVLNSCMFENEFFSRVSGDNFILVMQYISKLKFTQRLDQIINKEIQETVLNNKKYEKINIRSGVYFLGINDIDLREPMHNAVQAKSWAKEKGLKFAIFDSVYEEKAMGDRELERIAEDRIHANEFIPYFHPKIDLKKLEVESYEVLSRWKNKERGLLFPNKFIPILRKKNLLTKMDLKLFETVCELLKVRVNNGKQPMNVSFNFSKESLRSSDFVSNLYHIAKKYEISPKSLGIDITENITIENRDEIIERINELKSYGFSITLDHFGSEYSSFVDLQNCNIDYIKLDRALIDDINNSKTALLVKGIVDLCHNIGVKVACEGIETKDQLKLLKNADCDVVQGYLFCQPMPYSEIDS